MILLKGNLWEIKVTAKKGRGIFAAKDIPGGIIVGDYIGKVMRTAIDDVAESDGLYLMYYSDQASILPSNLQEPGVHLINHACNPNCWMYIYRGHTLFFTLRLIFCGEELTISYLLSPRDALCNPCMHECYCGSDNCLKTMHLTAAQYDTWSNFSKKQSKKTKRAKIRYGKNLAAFISYPKKIPDNSIYRLMGFAGKPPITLDDKKIPSVKDVRKMIRKTGKTINLPRLKKTILGVENNQIISVLL